MHPCSVKRERAAWSHKQCNVINRGLFSKCHVAVDPRPYFDACYFDTCGCDMGGDCECLCTAISAYAEACNEHGIHIKWRSQELCRKNYFFCLSTMHWSNCSFRYIESEEFERI